MKKIKIGISACLLGANVRYDGGNRRDVYITDTLGQYFEWAPVCPEVECGLGVPREAMKLIEDGAAPHLVTIQTGTDFTDVMMKWMARKLKEIEKEKLCGFIFKSKSPSSAIVDAEIYCASRMTSRRGAGIFGGAFMKYFPLTPVIDDIQLNDPVLRKNFFEKIFASAPQSLKIENFPF